jgi:hypothetical protein
MVACRAKRNQCGDNLNNKWLPPGDQNNLAHNLPGFSFGLSVTLSVPACCLGIEISFSIVLERKTLKKNEVNEDGRVAVSAPI